MDCKASDQICPFLVSAPSPSLDPVGSTKVARLLVCGRYLMGKKLKFSSRMRKLRVLKGSA